MDWKGRHIISKFSKLLKEKVDLDILRHLLEKQQIFTKAMLADIYDPSNDDDDFFYDLLCTRGPSAFPKFIHILRQVRCKCLSRLLQLEYACEENSPVFYKMTSKPIGFCLIIINEKIDNLLMLSQVDASSLESLFESLGYVVTVAWNLKREEMLNCLLQFSQNPYLSQVDSVIVFIVTHGNQIDNWEFLFGVDSLPVFLCEIYTMFDNNNCPRLEGKPKLFFFQSCRGSEENLLTCGWKYASCDAVEQGYVTDSEKTPCLPAQMDMIVVHSTLPYHDSFHNNEEDSWLCRDVVDVFSVNYLRHDLDTMLKSVCKRMEERRSDGTTKQTIHVEAFGVLGIIKFGHNA